MILKLTNHQLALRLRNNAGWAAALLVWAVVMVAIFPSIAKVDFAKLLESYPQEVLQAMGIQDVASFNTAIGYLNGELFSLVFPLTIVFLPLGVISRFLPSAEEDGSLDSLLCTPVGRRDVIAATALTAALSTGVVLFTIWLGTLIAAELIGVDLGYADLAQSCAALFPLATLIGGVGLLVASARSGRGATIGIAGAVLVVMYMAPVVASFVSSLDWLKTLSIFHYYNEWLHDGIDWAQYLAALALAAALSALAAQLFNRRDVAT